MRQSDALRNILAECEESSKSQREKGACFEQLVIKYFENDALYRDDYKEILFFGDWARRHGIDARDTGIDLVAITNNGENHAIQCKFYREDAQIPIDDINSFLALSSKNDFTHRFIVTTTNNWSDNAYAKISNQNPKVTLINRTALEDSNINWELYSKQKDIVLQEKKKLRPHQVEAKAKVIAGFKEADRGKLVMACGTGKTITSLKIAEEIAGVGKSVLFLVPSLALISQSLTEWMQQAECKILSFAVCSDTKVGKRRNISDDSITQYTHELAYPATTDAESLLKAMGNNRQDEVMTVVFATYYSIGVIAKAQELGLGEFDLIICDEAHRTVGDTREGDIDSSFLTVHDNNKVKGKKRLYMTATPRIYGEAAKKTEGVKLYSMDDEAIFGKYLHVLNFEEAVKQDLLSDYKVLVLHINENEILERLEKLFNDTDINVDDAAKIVGCWKALAKYDVVNSQFLSGDTDPMKRALAFCQVIDDGRGNTHKVSSKQIAKIFNEVVRAYQESEISYLRDEDPNCMLDPALAFECLADHVDGSMNAGIKTDKINWLKDEEGEACKILSNVRCLSEGVDVPALDAILFLTPKNSEIDVVQSVGRVMRKAPGKKLGYVILPVVTPANIEAHDALDKNENYKVVWKVLNALRAHDESISRDAWKLKLDGVGDKIEVISVVNRIYDMPNKTPLGRVKTIGGSRNKKNKEDSEDEENEGEGERELKQSELEFAYKIGEIERKIKAAIVTKVGDRNYSARLASSVSGIANRHIERINNILQNEENIKEREAFNAYLTSLRNDINKSIDKDEAIEMLAQHLITKPVFDALFGENNFTKHNPVSKALEYVLDVLESKNFAAQTKHLEEYYEFIRTKFQGIKTPEGRQEMIKELYNEFFDKAFPKMKERLGIVYTPIEIIDFIIHSINDVLKDQMNTSLSDNDVHILDPFTGTGTFITRLLQNGAIPLDKLEHKYKNRQIHANEIVLLAYYIAAINIESVYHGLLQPEHYCSFEGICLTDTFEMSKKADLISSSLKENSERIKNQENQDIKVIIGNPPYSAGQKSGNDDNANTAYPHLHERIEQSYGQHSTSRNISSLYDSYILALRWASDKIKQKGVIGFVTNAGFLDSKAASGLRKCLSLEFSTLYIFNLRGNTRLQGEARRKEKGNVFGQSTTTPVAISILVKNAPATTSPQRTSARANQADLDQETSASAGGENGESGENGDLGSIGEAGHHGKIYYQDIGDYLSREQKLAIIKEFKSIKNIPWQEIKLDKYNDWLNHRDPSFANYLPLGDKRTKSKEIIFHTYSMGVVTARDAWCYNSSKYKLANNVNRMINFYNSECEKYAKLPKLSSKDDLAKVRKFVNLDHRNISWSRDLFTSLAKGRYITFIKEHIRISLYSPFYKRYLYFDNHLNWSRYLMPYFFPSLTDDQSANSHAITPISDWCDPLIAPNKVITLGGKQEFSALITDVTPDINVHRGDGAYSFPLYIYEKLENESGDLFNTSPTDPSATEVAAAPTAPSQNLTSTSAAAADGVRSDLTPNTAGAGAGPGQRDDDMSESNAWKASYTRKYAITDYAQNAFESYYSSSSSDTSFSSSASASGVSISKEDIFYYIYGLLHNKDYKKKYGNNLIKELPRIPYVKRLEDFYKITEAGRKLADLHINYEKVKPYEATIKRYGIITSWDEIIQSEDRDFYVTKMQFISRNDKKTIIYNHIFSITDIPEKAYQYTISGKSAIEWIMERQGFSQHKETGIINDTFDYALEAMHNPRYPLELLLRIITVSLETLNIIDNMPEL